MFEQNISRWKIKYFVWIKYYLFKQTEQNNCICFQYVFVFYAVANCSCLMKLCRNICKVRFIIIVIVVIVIIVLVVVVVIIFINIIIIVIVIFVTIIIIIIIIILLLLLLSLLFILLLLLLLLLSSLPLSSLPLSISSLPLLTLYKHTSVWIYMWINTGLPCQPWCQVPDSVNSIYKARVLVVTSCPFRPKLKITRLWETGYISVTFLDD